MIDDQVSGLLVPVGDIYSMTRALNRLIQNKEFREELGRNARESSNRFRLENIANRIVSFCYHTELQTQIKKNHFEHVGERT